MLRVGISFLLTILVLVPVSSVQADWQTSWQSFWHRVHLDWHRNNCWPEPFTTMDQRAVCAAFSGTIANGWKRQNTLGDFYFDSERHVLNEAGQRKLYEILTTSPEQFRTVYVVRTMDGEAAERRLDSVQVAAADMVAGQPLPEVIPVTIEPRTWPADYIDAIDRKIQSTIPDPRLPTFVETTDS
jgi:hypothetical protein